MFLIQSARSEDGRRAMKAYRNYKKIALGTESKIHVLQDLLTRHKRDKVLIFTAENQMVYRISNDYLIPAITHETNVKERKFWLDAFNKGDVLALATSKVLNEGVNIPDASVAIILSGSGSSREHIQRLGRILRKKEDKQAILYEVVTRDTTEEYTSQKRSDARQFHDAIGITAIALTKLDGTAKGGVIIGICDERKLPVAWAGVGEKVADLRPFEPQEFVQALFD